MEYKTLIKKAYKKLKSSVYFDRTQSILRNEIVEFESDNDNFDKTLDELAVALESKEKFEDISKEILSGIGLYAFPKNVQQSTGNNQIIKNFADKKCKVDKSQYFINLDIRGHILGILWIICIGYRIDKIIYEHSYGNRIRKTLINELSKEPSYSPYLFEPYFVQYESWRDKALDKAKALLKNNQDAVVITMDFQRFYYSVDVDKEVIKALFEDAKGEEIKYPFASMLNDFIADIIQVYAKHFADSNEFDGRNILPIGFLPSNIIANWCLKNFDKAIVDGWNPIYYGRYVDDILIIEKVEKNSDLYKRVHDKSFDQTKIIDFFMGYCSRWEGGKSVNCNECNIYTKDSCENIKCSNIPLIRAKKINDDKIEYSVNQKFNIIPNNKSRIVFQNTKLKVFYFDSGETDALITCFQENISRNKSEFRQMPEDNAVFQSDDYSEIYEVKNEESLNKFRGIDGITLDKYSLSKFIGKYLRIGSLVNDKVESHFERDILKIFNNFAIVENYLLWERILTIFVINERYEGLQKFISKIVEAIDQVEYVDSNNELINDKTKLIKDSMYKTLYSAIMRSFAFVYNRKIDNIFTDILEDSDNKFVNYLYQNITGDIEIFTVFKNSVIKNILKTRLNYIKTKMIDKTLIPIIIDSISMEFASRNKINISDFNCIINMLETKSKENQEKEDYNFGYKKNVYYPYMVNMYDIAINNCLLDLYYTAKSPFVDLKKVCDEQKKDYVKFNYNEDSYDKYDSEIKIKVECERIKNSDNFIVKVDNKKKSKLKIAVSNVRLNYHNFENVMIGKPNRSYSRYKDISIVVNEAIKQKVDMLVMPESFVPFEWLTTLARTCAKNKIAVVTGVEHILLNKNVYNLTAVILPYLEEDYHRAYISFHLKRHYAPHEEKDIKGYRYFPIEGTHYELYKWNDCYFPVYCCFELASIKDRAIFQSYADMLVAVEWNKDVKYYSNILEALSRDIHCYCIQVNTSEYGDSRITEPSKSDTKDLIRTKGGENNTILVGEVDIERLRKFQSVEFSLQQEDKRFKPTPPEFDKEIALKKIQGEEIF